MAALVASLVGMTVLACGATPPPAPVRPHVRPLGGLHTLIPADSTLIVLARPRQLMRDASTRTVVSAIFSSEQLEAFAARTGVDPRELDEVAVAVHPDGRVILARGRIDAPFAVREAGERMAPLESSTDEPFVRRAGFLGAGRVDVAALSGDTLAWIDGTPQLAASVLAAARRPARRRAHPFNLDSVHELRESFAGAPFVLFAPLPLGLPRDTPIGMLLAREESMAVAARPTDGEGVQVGAELRGEFPPGAEGNFHALASSIAESDLGAAIGARDALPSLRIVTEEGRVAMSAEVRASILATGLRAVLLAEMPELLDAPPTPPPTPPDHDTPADAGASPGPIAGLPVAEVPVAEAPVARSPGLRAPVQPDGAHAAGAPASPDPLGAGGDGP